MGMLDVVTTMAVGLLIGNELAVSLFLDPALWALADEGMSQALARSMGRIMPFWYGLCLALLGAETAVRWSGPQRGLLLSAVVLWAGVIAYTLIALVPLNNRVAATGWKDGGLQTHRRWDTRHRVRIALLLVAFGCFLRAV